MKHINEDSAVVGIVSAILLVGLFVTVFTIIQTVYVPQWMEQRESEHLSNTASQFMLLKFAIDTQIVSKSTLSITTPITLGNDKIPYFLSERSYGSLEVTPNSQTISIRNSSTTLSFKLGDIKYSSRNNYYVDQKFIYENGAIIVSQQQGSIMTSPGFFSVKKSGNILNISFTLVNISSIESKNSAYGYSTASILTKYDPTYDISKEIKDVSKITITTSYSKVWKKFFEKILDETGLKENNDYTLTENSNSITINFNKSNTLQLSVKKIITQISPGWIS